MSDAYYSQFAVKFTGSSCFNVEETSALFRSVVFVARRFFATKGEIYDDGQVREFLMWLLKSSTSELYKYNYQFRAVHWYAVTFAKPIYNSSEVEDLSNRIIISYYSTTRLEQEQILGLFELCPNPRMKIPEKFVLNSIWLVYGSTVIRLQRLQTATCRNMLVSILHYILTSLEFLTSFQNVFLLRIIGK